MFPVLHQDFHGLQPRIAPHRPALTAWSVRPSRSPPVAVLGAPPGGRAMECGHVEPPRCLIQGPSPAETYKYLFIYLFVYLFIYLFTYCYLYLYVYFHLSIYLFIYSFIYLSMFISIFMFIYLCVCVIYFFCVCRYVYIYILYKHI